MSQNSLALHASRESMAPVPCRRAAYTTKRSRDQALRMSLVQALVHRTRLEQLGVRSFRGHAPLVEHDDAVGYFQRVEAMRNQKRRSALDELVNDAVYF